MAINPLAIGGGVVATAAVVGGGLYAGGVFSSSKGPEGGITENNVVTAEWHPLSEDSDYFESSSGSTTVSATYSGKYGSTYSKFLVGVTNAAAGKNPNNNDLWWKETYNKKYKKSKATDGFANLASDTDLKNACKEAYGADATPEDHEGARKLKITKTGTGEQNVKHFKETDFWMFCTHFGEKVKTLKDMKNGEEDYLENTYGKDETNRADLIATKATSNKANEHFWKVKEEELKNAQDSDFDTTKATTSEFKKLHNKLKGTVDGGATPAKPTLRETCEEAYKKTKSDGADTHPLKDTGKFCSLSGNALTKPA